VAVTVTLRKENGTAVHSCIVHTTAGMWQLELTLRKENGTAVHSCNVHTIAGMGQLQ
jgi:hypothetical protein